MQSRSAMGMTPPRCRLGALGRHVRGSIPLSVFFLPERVDDVEWPLCFMAGYVCDEHNDLRCPVVLT